jgi:hypothetical protein
MPTDIGLPSAVRGAASSRSPHRSDGDAPTIVPARRRCGALLGAVARTVTDSDRWSSAGDNVRCPRGASAQRIKRDGGGILHGPAKRDRLTGLNRRRLDGQTGIRAGSRAAARYGDSPACAGAAPKGRLLRGFDGNKRGERKDNREHVRLPTI